MSNTIKLKRGTGSDPGSSALSVGEVALRTDNGKLFTKKDDGSIVQIGGGAGAIDDDAVTTAKIADGAVTNAKVASDAAIAGTKISPDFGSQDITTTNDLNGKSLNLTHTSPQIQFTDSNGNPDYTVKVDSGLYKIIDATNSNADRFVINTDGHIDITGNVDFGAGIDVTGNITATGDLAITSSLPKISLTDSGDNPDYEITNTNGSLNFKDTTNDATRISIQSSATTIANNLDCGAGIDVTGNITATGTITSTGLIMADNKSILLGASDDFRIRHTGSHSEITDEGTGNLRLGSNQVIIGSPTFDETSAKFTDDGSVELYFNNSKKIETKDYGAFINGHLQMDDDSIIKLGNSNDLQIYHDGDHSFIDEVGNGALRLRSDSEVAIQSIVSGTNKNMAKFIPDGQVELYHNDTKQFYTTGDGVESNAEFHFKAPSSSTGEQVGRLEWWNENDAGVMAKIAVDRTASSNAPADLVFSTSANVDTTANGGDGDITERLRITSAGNVGIGTDPATILHVKANVGDMLRLDRDNSGSVGNQIAFRHKDGSGNFIETCSINAATASNAASGNLRFSTKADGGSNTERMRIKSDGTVDIGGNLDVGAGVDVTGTCTATSFSGSGASLTSLNASNISSGTIPAARVGDITGNAASADTVDLSGISTNSEKQVVVSNNNDGAGRTLCVDSSSSAFTYNPSTNVLTASGGFSTSGNITVSGTVDGRDVASDGSKLDGIASGATNVTNNNQLTNGAGYITSVSGQNYNSLSNLPTIPTNNNQLSNGAGYITSVSGQNYNLLSNRPTIPTNNNQLSNGAGYITSGSSRACQAWVNFQGSNGAKRDDLNVSSVSDNGVGQYTVSFASSMPNDDYCIVNGYLTSQGNANTVKITAQSSGSFSLKTGSFQDGSSNTNRDFTAVYCAVFAD